MSDSMKKMSEKMSSYTGDFEQWVNHVFIG